MLTYLYSISLGSVFTIIYSFVGRWSREIAIGSCMVRQRLEAENMFVIMNIYSITLIHAIPCRGYCTTVQTPMSESTSPPF